MAIKATFKDTTFGVADVIRVTQRIPGEGKDGKDRMQIFEGTVIKIKGRDNGKTFTVRKIGAQNIGVEQIFPFSSPLVENIEVVKKGMEGTRRSKLYYIRDKSKRDIDKIYSRASRKQSSK